MPGETISAFTPSHASAPGKIGERDPVGRRRGPRRLAVVPGDDLGAAGCERRDGRPARAAEAEHRHLVAVIAADRDHRRHPQELGKINPNQIIILLGISRVKPPSPELQRGKSDHREDRD